MLRFEDELREEDLIFAFINQESAHFSTSGHKSASEGYLGTKQHVIVK